MVFLSGSGENIPRVQNVTVLVLLPAAPVSETVKKQLLERQQRMAAAEDAPEMSKLQEAALQRDIAAILLPGETVTTALQRLGKQDKRPAGVKHPRHFIKSLFTSEAHPPLIRMFLHVKACLVHDTQSEHKFVLIVQKYVPILCIKLLLCRFKSQSRTSCMCLPSSLQPDALLQGNETEICSPKLS